MNERHVFRTVSPASIEVRSFLEKEPNADWQQSLEFLLEQFPQVENGESTYVIEGGAAAALLVPDRIVKPKDIDLLVFKHGFEKNFLNTKIFDAKSTEEWFESRGLERTKEKTEILRKAFTEIMFRGKRVRILSAPFLAFTKLSPFNGRPPREQDLADAASLGMSPRNWEDAVRALKP